ncbi:hypothetical protein SLEP1_g25357 [Rubroshorea leprosula]|uniref:Teneurin NHL domain-containing protein n=1 Tax=Rubroshorea leprosula TaxID=152421 RepID=A0AAV5JQU0_9ROSI|nr:hypothetical protein SLEP1_g25357 [Rubroshorea leprosula]
MASYLYLLAVFLLFNTAATFTVSSKLILEDGYEVTTVIEGHKLKINPHAVLPRPGSSDLIVLDSSSSVFYSISFPLSNESVPERLSGDGVAGHSDGEAGGARFNKPKSFAVDAKGNIYVADKNNHAIRKIDASGKVTTIAGGNSNKTGHHDGPAQDATFSDDFEVVFVPERCVLLVSDHGSQLVRLINLKAEDCVMGSHSALGAVTTWSVALLVSCILGIIIGLLIRPYVIPHQGTSLVRFCMTWKHCLINLGKQALICCFDIRNAAASSKPYFLTKQLFWLSLAHLSLMFRINYLESQSPQKDSVSLLDSDVLYKSEMKESDRFTDQLKDLISFDESPELPATTNERGEWNEESCNILSNSQGGIDNMIQANIKGFAEVAEKTTVLPASMVGKSGLVRRR